MGLCCYTGSCLKFLLDSSFRCRLHIRRFTSDCREFISELSSPISFHMRQPALWKEHLQQVEDYHHPQRSAFMAKSAPLDPLSPDQLPSGYAYWHMKPEQKRTSHLGLRYLAASGNISSTVLDNIHGSSKEVITIAWREDRG